MGKSKRATLPFRSDYTKTFVKAWERYNKAGRRDMHETAAIMSMVLSGNPLPAHYNDHALTGNMQGFASCISAATICWSIALMTKSIWWYSPIWAPMPSYSNNALQGFP